MTTLEKRQDKIIRELMYRLEKLEKQHCSYLTRIGFSGDFYYIPNNDFLQPAYQSASQTPSEEL